MPAHDREKFATQVNSAILRSVWHLANPHTLARPMHLCCRIDGNHLADHEPVEEMAQGG